VAARSRPKHPDFPRYLLLGCADEISRNIFNVYHKAAKNRLWHRHSKEAMRKDPPDQSSALGRRNPHQ
jgi:hypothetical protein